MDNDLLYRFFRDEVSNDEADRVKDWALSSQRCANEFEKSFSHYSSFTLAMLELEENPRLYLSIRKAQRKRKHRFVYGSIAFAAASMALVLALVLPTRSHTVEYLTASTGAGERVTLTLGDSTVVTLNSGTTLRYPAGFSKKERRVSLEGEALFEVSKNADRPFVVETFAYDVKVLGTRFNLLAEEKERRFSTSLLEGSVALLEKESGEEKLRMVPGERAFADTPSGSLLCDTPSDITQSILWTKGILSLGGLSFEEAIRALEKAFGTEIIVDCTTMPSNRSPRMKVYTAEGLAVALEVLSHGADFSWTYNSSDNTYRIYDKHNQ